MSNRYWLCFALATAGAFVVGPVLSPPEAFAQEAANPDPTKRTGPASMKLDTPIDIDNEKMQHDRRRRNHLGTQRDAEASTPKYLTV